MRVWTLLLFLVLIVGIVILIANLFLLIKKLSQKKAYQASRSLADQEAHPKEFLQKDTEAAQKYDVHFQKIALIVAALLIMVSLAILLFLGKPQSIMLSTQLPAQYNRTSAILTDDLELTGSKAVTLLDAGDSDGFMDFLLSFTDGLFRYSHEYLPDDMRAHSADEIGYIIVAKHELENVGSYTNGGKALQHNITVSIFDGDRVLAEETFKGEGAPSSRGGSGDWRGNPPDAQVIAEWVAEQFESYKEQ